MSVRRAHTRNGTLHWQGEGDYVARVIVTELSSMGLMRAEAYSYQPDTHVDATISGVRLIAKGPSRSGTSRQRITRGRFEE